MTKLSDKIEPSSSGSQHHCSSLYATVELHTTVHTKQQTTASSYHCNLPVLASQELHQQLLGQKNHTPPTKQDPVMLLNPTTQTHIGTTPLSICLKQICTTRVAAYHICGSFQASATSLYYHESYQGQAYVGQDFNRKRHWLIR